MGGSLKEGEEEDETKGEAEVSGPEDRLPGVGLRE